MPTPAGTPLAVSEAADDDVEEEEEMLEVLEVALFWRGWCGGLVFGVLRVFVVCMGLDSGVGGGVEREGELRMGWRRSVGWREVCVRTSVS